MHFFVFMTFGGGGGGGDHLWLRDASGSRRFKASRLTGRMDGWINGKWSHFDILAHKFILLICCPREKRLSGIIGP